VGIHHSDVRPAEYERGPHEDQGSGDGRDRQATIQARPAAPQPHDRRDRAERREKVGERQPK